MVLCVFLLFLYRRSQVPVQKVLQRSLLCYQDSGSQVAGESFVSRYTVRNVLSTDVLLQPTDYDQEDHRVPRRDITNQKGLCVVVETRCYISYLGHLVNRGDTHQGGGILASILLSLSQKSSLNFLREKQGRLKSVRKETKKPMSKCNVKGLSICSFLPPHSYSGCFGFLVNIMWREIQTLHFPLPLLSTPSHLFPMCFSCAIPLCMHVISPGPILTLTHSIASQKWLISVQV